MCTVFLQAANYRIIKLQVDVLSMIWLTSNRIKLDWLLFLGLNSLLLHQQTSLFELRHFSKLSQTFLIISFTNLELLYEFKQIVHSFVLHLRVGVHRLIPTPELFGLFQSFLLLRPAEERRGHAHVFEVAATAGFEIWIVFVLAVDASPIHRIHGSLANFLPAAVIKSYRGGVLDVHEGVLPLVGLRGIMSLHSLGPTGITTTIRLKLVGLDKWLATRNRHGGRQEDFHLWIHLISIILLIFR